MNSNINVCLKIYLESYSDKKSRGIIDILYGKLNMKSYDYCKKYKYSSNITERTNSNNIISRIYPLFIGILNIKSSLEREFLPERENTFSEYSSFFTKKVK